jgi:hypothetical protein
MSKKEKVMKLVDESTGLMECLVCGAKHNAVMKPGPDGKSLFISRGMPVYISEFLTSGKPTKG